MTYRWQEIIKILIPGFYLLFGVGISCFITHNAFDKEIIETVGKLSAIFLVLLFFTAFVVGYINEIISGGLESCLYLCDVPRPSRLILNNCFTRFQIIRNRDLREKLELEADGSVDNKNLQKLWHRQNRVLTWMDAKRSTINLFCQETSSSLTWLHQ